jgi:hypothetical protein
MEERKGDWGERKLRGERKESPFLSVPMLYSVPMLSVPMPLALQASGSFDMVF